MSAKIITGGHLDPRPAHTTAKQHLFTLQGSQGTDSAVIILTDQELHQWHSALSLAKLRTTNPNPSRCLVCGRPTRRLTFGVKCEVCLAEDGPTAA